MSSDPRPSFHMPACPLCSAIGSTENPIWRYAHNTSSKRGRAAYAFTGCRHVAELFVAGKLYDDPEEWKLVESAWVHACEAMLAARTERWTPEERGRFARALEARPFVPGAVEELPLEGELPPPEVKPEDEVPF